MTEPHPKPPADPISEGARARSYGRPKDACPCPARSDARKAWFEGYDGETSDQAPDLPMDAG